MACSWYFLRSSLEAWCDFSFPEHERCVFVQNNDLEFKATVLFVLVLVFVLFLNIRTALQEIWSNSDYTLNGKMNFQ